jgi:isopentenyl diphosphate isomerase/L-lactate dehydrogenase-like FMN-dependent dehydrogenase
VGHAVSHNEKVTWADLQKLREAWPRKFVVKGVLSAHDARAALECGADAIVGSNHGGRALDSAAATLDVLPEVVDAVGGRCTILIDGGIRRGGDIVKAIALGATAVMVGRPTLWGVSAGGQAGAEKALRILAREFEMTMAFVGCRTPEEIKRWLVFST